MSKAGNFGPWVFVAVAIATIANPGFTHKEATGAAAFAAGGQFSPTARSPGNGPSGDDEIDTLDTIGESFALDLSTEGLKRRATRSLKTLRSREGPSTDQQKNAIDFFEAFLKLPIFDAFVEIPIKETEERDRAAQAVQVIKEEYSRGAATPESPGRIQKAANEVDRFLKRYFDQYALSDQHASKEEILLARDFERLDKTALKIAVLEQVVRDRSRVTFLIATLPDPIDSYTGWQFDPMLDAIAQAVAASDYVLDRFHFPDSDKEETSESQSTVERGRLHELEPGVVVFRKPAEKKDGKSLDPTSSYGDRLVVLLVHENPAAGIHVRALANALRLVVKCRSLTRDPRDLSKEDPTIRILGPTFSGSSESLNRALHMVNSPDAYDVRVVSGSATDPRNKDTVQNGLTDSGTKLQVQFRATVHPDDVLLPRLVSQIKDADWSRRVAVLFEANTQYGQQLWRILSARVVEKRPFEFIQLPFPMNVSRLRTTVEAQDPAHAGLLGLPSRFRPLPMEAQGSPSDQIPQFNPKTMATYVELALAGTFETMRREHVKTVALMATDPRDKLFLAQQIARYAPDVSIFTAESDSLYIHPDYSSYLRGAFVVSTYPLYSGNQSWSYGYQGDSERRQFANSSAQGIYNAALALLDYDKDGRKTTVGDPPRLLEYGMPGKECLGPCKPPVWISVVGRSSAWPIRAYRVDDALDSAYVFTVAPTAVLRSPAVFPSPAFYALLVLLTFAILVGWAIQGVGRFRTTVGPLRSAMRIDESDRPRRAYLLVCLTGVLLIQTFIWELSLLRVLIEDRSTWPVMALVATSLGLVGACHMTARVLATMIRADVRAVWRRLSWRRISMWGALSAVVVCVWSILNGALYMGEYFVLARGNDQSGNVLAAANDQNGVISLLARADGQSAVVSFLARALDFGNGVCPTLPVLFLGGALTLWGVTELSRVRRGRVALADAAVHPLLQEMLYADVQKLSSPWELLNRSILRVPSGGIAVAALVFVATCIFAFDPFKSWLVTIEGPRFGAFVSATLLLVQVMLTLALVQFAYLWSRIKQLLEFMARHRLAGAYKRVPREIFPSQLFPSVPRLSDLQMAVAHWERLAGVSDPAGRHAGAALAPSINLGATFQKEMHTSPDTPWATSETWKALLDVASYTAGRLRMSESTGPVGGPKVPVPTPGAGTIYNAAAVVDVVAADRAIVRREEELPAMLVSFVVRDALARLAQNLVFVIGGVILVFCSYTLFPFQQHTQLQVLGWVYIGITFTTILTVLVQIKRNQVVAGLTSATPGVRATWDGEFVLKVTVFALLPLIALFAAQFPDIGALLLRCLEPVQKALP